MSSTKDTTVRITPDMRADLDSLVARINGLAKTDPTRPTLSRSQVARMALSEGIRLMLERLKQEG